MNEILIDAKVKLWSACKLGDSDLLSSVMDTLLKEVEKSMELEKQSKEDTSVEANLIINMDDITKLINDGNEDGNTMLHLAALSGHLKLVWYVNIIYLIKTFPSLNCTQSITREEFYFRQLLEIGSDPCNKNKKLQTPYAAATDKETRNTFRRFMGANPDKFDYSKVLILDTSIFIVFNVYICNLIHGCYEVANTWTTDR